VQNLGGGIIRIDFTAQNPCTRLEVETSHGTFRTEDVLHYGTHSVMDSGEVTEANFVGGLSAFDAFSVDWVKPGFSAQALGYK
jgi:hypothetical protein